jgi:hypothetical protein
LFDLNVSGIADFLADFSVDLPDIDGDVFQSGPPTVGGGQDDVRGNEAGATQGVAQELDWRIGNKGVSGAM